MNICHVDLQHEQTTKTTTNKTKRIQDYLCGSSVQKSMFMPIGIQLGLMCEFQENALYVVYTAGEFVWNEGGVVPANCYLRLISQCVIFI
jgi:hypothetical protein